MGRTKHPGPWGYTGGGIRWNSVQVSRRHSVLQVVWGCADFCRSFAGADFAYRASFNELLEVEWMGGDSEMTEEEYAEERYRRDQLRPGTGGRRFRARRGGAGYVRRERPLD